MKILLKSALFNRLTGIVFFVLIITGCENRSLFTELGTNRLKVIIKGTFESNGPVRGWAWNSLSATSSLIQDDSVFYHSYAVDDEKPTSFMLDIAEMRLNNTKFANYRQTYNIPLVDNTNFFNGTGISFPNDDPQDGRSFSYVKVYLRKMLFDNAKKFKYGSTGWEFVEDITDIFHEKTVSAFNFNKHMVNSHYDTLRKESSRINRVFPLIVPIPDGFKYSKHNDSTVLEIRIVIKNFIKKYETNYYKDGIFYADHFYGFSDWLRDVKSEESDMGGNAIAVARTYVPELTGDIQGTNNNAQGYIIAIPSGDDLTDYSIPLVSRGEDPADSSINCDLPYFVIKDVPSILYIEELLDYYLKYEKYKYERNTKLAGCIDQAIFEEKWTANNNVIENFIMPPLVVWNEGFSQYIIENVMPGIYDLYFIPVLSTTYGQLFYDSDVLTASSTKKTVTVNTGEIITAPPF